MERKDQEPELDLFGNAITLPPTVRRVISTSVEISQEPPDRADFLHAVLCQVGMPRKATEARVFERWQGNVGLSLEAGRLGLGGRFVDQPLPYGVKPRLVMIHISTEAVRTKSRVIPIGDSMRDFLEILGLGTNAGRNGVLPMFKKQMLALAACRLTLAMQVNGVDRNIHTQPIDRFDAWLSMDGKQRSLWSGELEISERFYETLTGNAVPLDHRALSALKHSSLALDIYSWLAHRLCRVRKVDGVKLSWENLREQFGQEYNDPKNFKKEFRQSLRQVLAVYPDAHIEDVPGGLLLRPSNPPLPKTRITVPLIRFKPSED
jgi:hypothetical protein